VNEIEVIEQSIRSGAGTLDDWLTSLHARADWFEERGAPCPVVCPRCPLTECVRQLASQPPPRVATFWWGRLARLVEDVKDLPDRIAIATACRVPTTGMVAVVRVTRDGFEAGVFTHYLNTDFEYNLDPVAPGATPGLALAIVIGKVRMRPRRIDVQGWK